jgi:spore coat protein A
MKISRRKFLQVTGLAAGASLLPLPVKYLGAGKAEAFYQTSGVPLFRANQNLRLTEIPVALPNPTGISLMDGSSVTEWATNELPLTGNTFPVGFPKVGPVAGMVFPHSPLVTPTPGNLNSNYTIPSQTGAPVTGVRHYSFSVNQYSDPGVVPSLGSTTLWGYKPALTLLEGLWALGALPNNSGAPLALVSVPAGTQAQRHLGGIMLVESYKPVQITMVNNLELNHIIPNDLTIPGAIDGADRTAVHFHGGLVPWISDGGPFDWFCSTKRSESAKACGSSFINNKVLQPSSVDPTAPYNSKTQGEYYWPNQQSARFGWFHDHAFGITRINAYAGIATGQIFRDDFERQLVTLGLPPLLENSLLDRMGIGTATLGLSDPTVNGYAPVREYPLVLQDKIFIGASPGIRTLDPSWPATCPSAPGSLWYPHTYERARWARALATKTLPTQSVIAEMFGDTMLVNGTAYPMLAVQPRRYRFRLLNAQNARFMNMQLYYAWDVGFDGSVPGNATLSGGIVLVTSLPLRTGQSFLGQCLNRPFQDGTVATMTVPTPSPDPRLTAGSAYGPGWVTQIGCETGFLPKVIAANVSTQTGATNNPDLSFQTDFALLIGPAERPDIVVDFSVSAGQTVILYGDAPGPFPGGDVRNDYFPRLANGNSVNTRTPLANGPNSRIYMQFNVSASNTITGNPDGATLIKPGYNLTTDPPTLDPPVSWNSEALVTTTGGPPNTFTGTVSPFTITRTGGAAIRVGLFEVSDAYGRLEQRVGALDASIAGTTYPDGVPYDIPLLSPEEIHRQNDVEVWEVFNTTADCHPMHFHLFNAQVINRQAFTRTLTPPYTYELTSGTIRNPLADEYGFKETIKCWPGEVVRFVVRVGVPPILTAGGNIVLTPTSPRGTNVTNSVYNKNEYVWHCHILEHEEHDMMRPLCVLPILAGSPQYPDGPINTGVVQPPV